MVNEEEKTKAPCMREPEGVIANDAIQLFLDCANPEKGKAFNEKTLEEKVDIVFELLLLLIKINWITYRPEPGLESVQNALLKDGLGKIVKKHKIR